MANANLMFEVGVKEAGTQLSDLENRINKLAETGEKGIQLNITFTKSQELTDFIKALNSLGNGKILEPMLNKIESLQTSMIRLGMIPKDIDYSALEQQLNKLAEAYKNLEKARGTSAETARQQAANLLKSNIEKEFGMPVNVLRAVQDTYKNMGNTIQENLSKVATSVASSTGQSNTALEQENAAVNATVQKLNELVTEKQQVVNAEKQLAESSANTAKSVANEGNQAKSTSDALDTVAKSNKKAGEQAAQTGQQIDTLSQKYQNLALSIENRLANQSKLLESGSSHYDAQLRQSITKYQSLFEDVKKATSSNAGADVFAVLRTRLSGFDIEFANVNKEALAFRKTLDQNTRAEERQINAGLKAEENAGRARVKERERQEKQYEQIWQKGLRDRESAAQKAAQTEAQSARDASVEYTRLQGVLKRLNQLKTNAVSAKVDTAEIDGLISKVKTLQTLYSEMALGNGRSVSGLLFGDLKGNANTRSTMLEIGQVFTETNNNIRESNRLSRESEKEAKAKAAAEVQANKDVQKEIDRTKAKIEELNAAITRGRQAGRDMSALESQRSRLEGQKMLLERLTTADKADRTALDRRLNNVKVLREESERLLRSETTLTKAREQANKANDRRAIKNLQDEENSLNQAWIKYNELTAKIKELDSLRARGVTANIDVSQIDAAITRYHDLKNLMDQIISNNGRTAQGKLTGEILGGADYKKQILDATSELNTYKKSLDDIEKRMHTAGATARTLGKQIDTLEARKVVDFNGMDTTRLDTAIQRIKNIRDELERFSQTGKSVYGVNADEITRTMGLAAAKKEAANATTELNRQLQQGKSGTVSLTEAEQRLAHAIKGTNESMRGQVNILADLKTMATQYLGVWGAQNFVHNIIQIGGQLEQQRLSIGAILGDMAAGQHLFDQIKNLALTSPFGVMELDKDTKQLSAYGFKQSELFDMTKRLADISAGAGTEVSRLALALGHVRSEGALTGYTLRQFAMNNIPMLQKLSERLTKLEGQIVSTAEIRKRVSNKEIGYEDVIAVIKDLTNEGGMFFNMQETMADAVNAKFKNLKDSMDIMYGEMAEGGIGSALKWVAETLMSLTRNWEKTARVIGYGTAAFVAYRLAVTSANTQLLTYGSTLGATSKTLNAKAIALGVNTAAVKRLTADEVKEMVTLKLVTREQLLNAVATKKLTVDQAELAAATFGVTRAELESIASKGKLGVASAGLGLRLKGLALSLRGVGAALKTMLLNPVGIALMAITAGFEVFMRWKQKNSEIEESIEQLGKKGSEGYRNLAATLDKYSGNDGKMSESEYSTAISDIIDSLKNYAPNIHNIQEEAQSVDNLAERYRYLRDELESTKNAYADLERTKSFASNANESTGNIVDDTFTENVEDYIGKVQDLDKAEQELLQHRVALDKTIDELERKTGFKRRMDSNGNALPLIEQLKYIKNTDWNKVFSPMLASNSHGSAVALSDYAVAIKNMSETMRNEVMPDLQDFAYRLNNQYVGTFGLGWKENADHIKTAWMAVVSEIDKVPGMTDSVKRELLEKIFNETWKLNIDFSTGEVTESLTGWRKEMQDWLDANDLNIKIGFNDTPEDVAKKAKAMQETAQTQMDNAGKVLIGIGFKLDNLPSQLPAQLQTPWNQENFERYPESKATNDLIDKFKEHFHLNWQTKKDKANTKGNKGRSDDKEAKRLREVVKLYKDAFDWYNKYEKQVGKGSALSKVQEQFKPLFDQFSDQFKQTLSLDSIPLYKENLKSLLAEAEKLYQDPKHKNSYMVEAIKQIRDAINNVDFEELGNKQEEFLSKTQIQLDNLTRSWETFNSVRDATGNIDLAVQLSGAGYQAGETINLADALRKKIEGDFAAAGAIAIPFDINFSGEDIFNRIAAAMPEKTQDQIKGIVEEYKKWRDLQRDIYKQGITTISQLLGSAQDYKTVVGKINTSLAAQKEAIDRMEKPDGMSDDEWAAVKARAKALADAKAQNDIFKLSTEYINLMNHSLGMTSESIRTAAEACKNELGKNLKDNIITAEQYADEMAKIEKIMSDFKANGLFGRNSDLNSFIKGGTQGLVSRYTDQLAARRTELANQGKSKEEIENDEVVKRLKNLKSGLEDFANGLNSFASYIDFATNILQGFGDAAKNLSEMFDALGHESSANTWSDISDSIGAVTSGLQSLSSGMKAGANGDIGGAVSGVVGAVTSPITAFAQLHDKGIQREIEAIQKNIEALEANTNSIRAARERTLGYDTGALRRAMSDLYQNHTTKVWTPFADVDISNEAKKAMQEYYNAGTNKTGYAAELENLKEMRANYLEMYNEEEDKKKSSQDALDEYKKKIAELDEQIMFFVEDLANELWGIDFKAWASQISDALWTAFENGEDALDAFHDAAKDIISDVAKRMMTIRLIEPLFQELEEKLFGKIGPNGQRVGGAAYNYDTGEFNEKETLKIVGDFFGDDGRLAKAVGSMESFFKMAQDVTGFEFSGDKKKSSGTTNAIKSITENTADLLASYINSIRADVSVDRALMSQYFPMFHAAITSGNASLVNIENHTAAIMRSNETIANGITEMQSDIRGLKNKTWRVPVA